MQLYSKFPDFNEQEIPRDFDHSEQSIDLDALIAAGQRQWRIVAIAVAVATIFGFVYAQTAVPLYVATSSVLIDRQNSAVVDQLSTISGGVDDEASVLSQIELLKSDTIGLSVVDKLKLTENPEFNASNGSIVASLISAIRTIANVPGWFQSSIDSITNVEDLKRRRALGALISNMGVERLGRSYVIQISYTSPSPGLSASVAGAIADAYLTDKLDSKYDATRRAGDWLQDRIEELKQKSLESDLAVQKFRTANGLLSSDGRLVSDQQLTELNSAMIVAQADTAKAQAKYDRIQSILASGQSDAIVTEVLESSISNNLREKYLDASKRQAEIAARLGPNHIQVVRLRGEMRQYERLMFEELGRIAESSQSELDVAKSREKSLASSVSQASGISALANETQVQLRELERSAETYKNLYQTFLQRYQEAIQQQSFPITEARIISRATAPQRSSSPRKSLFLALSIILGCAAGGAIGAFREFRDRFFRTGEQVRDVLAVEFLGITPLVKQSEKHLATDVVADNLHPRSIRKSSAMYDHVIDHPLSAFAETLRSAKIAADLSIPGKQSRVIGIVSVLPSEGKSTIAINFAELLANQGARTVLIDGDLRNPGATRALGSHAEAGLLEAVLEEKPVRDLLLLNPKTKLAFLPAVIKRRVPHSSELLASVGMSHVLASASANTDYVVIDLPPLGPVVDARAIAAKVDGFIFVVEWGRTARSVVRQTLRNEPAIAEKCLGVILNKVDSDKMKYYRSYGSSEYYYSRYSSYYRED